MQFQMTQVLSKNKQSYDWINELSSDWSVALSNLTSFEYSNHLIQVILSFRILRIHNLIKNT